jgi:3-hydroxybutyryl-CoA dehydrogenase
VLRVRQDDLSEHGAPFDQFVPRARFGKRQYPVDHRLELPAKHTRHDVDENFTGPRLGVRNVLVLENLRPAVLAKNYCFHCKPVVYPDRMANKKDVRTVAVIGAGTMGRGIAHAGALAGFSTVLNDISDELLEKAHRQIRRDLEKGVEIGKVASDSMDEALSRLDLQSNIESAVSHADLIIEAVPEKVELKVDLFTRLDRLCSPHVVFASNTSALSITEMAGATKRPQQFIGMHFFNPVHKMKLVEIIRGLETNDETFQIAESVSKKMGKETVEVKESPGFVTSRINALIGNEAFYMLQEGIASARDIDKALKLGLNHPMGPFEMVDLVGLDTRLSILNFLHQTLGEKYRPCPLLVKYVKAGRLGKKVGRGVYEYSEPKR